MTRRVTGLLAAGGIALAAAGGVAGAADDETRRTVVVADPALVSTARAVAAREHADLRLPRTPTEELAVTHLFAARGYTIVGVGLVRRIAVDPVRARYPDTRFVLLDGQPLSPSGRRDRRPAGDVTVAACPPSC
jgi:hypothetical protein